MTDEQPGTGHRPTTEMSAPGDVPEQALCHELTKGEKTGSREKIAKQIRPNAST